LPARTSLVSQRRIRQNSEGLWEVANQNHADEPEKLNKLKLVFA
jgi:hypothetical protein